MIAERPKEAQASPSEQSEKYQSQGDIESDAQKEETESKFPEKSGKSAEISIEEPVQKLNESRYPFINPKLAKWVDESLGYEAIERLGEKPHPVEVIFELTANWVPELRSMPNMWKTPKNRLKSKLRKVREFFIAWGIQSPLHWCSFVEFDEKDERIVLNYNLTLAAMRNHFLVEENNNLIRAQSEQIILCRELQKENEEKRKKLEKVLDLIENDQSLPFAQLIKNLIEKEPSCFKPLNVE